MGIILFSVLALAAVIVSAVLVVRWALSRNRPRQGFPVERPDRPADDQSEDRPG